ncbi:hypothetical protein [Bradyrhizobium sp. OAE829]|uniref:hypothetical protein n=1 Tax=Bradyrhizobium sp. OAE829 TaxID=2663807 RepID=UPI0017896BA1
MNLPEQKPIQRHPQIVDDEERLKEVVETLEKENSSLKDLVIKLSSLIIRRVTGKK